MIEETLQLAPGHMLCVQDGEDLSVFVQEGRVIITQEHDLNDIEVAADAVFRICRPGKTIVMARCESTVRIALVGARIRAPHVVVKKYIGPRPVVLRKLKWSRRGALSALHAMVSILALRSRAR